MEQPFLRAYARHLVRVCHRRGAHAIGGMAAQIPIRGDEAASARALAAVRADKEREVNDGHDGTWVAHPGLVAVAREVFESRMEGPNQLDRPDAGAYATAADLLRVPAGTRTEQGLRLNVRVGVQYLEAWLSGVGCVPLNHLMEDAATAEISRSQLWQWTHHGAQLDDGRAVTRELVSTVLDEELGSASERTGHLARAADLFLRVATSEEMEEFLTVPAYAELHAIHDSPSSSTPRDSIKRRQS